MNLKALQGRTAKSVMQQHSRDSLLEEVNLLQANASV